MRDKRYVSEIFKDKPDKWGLRGDPYFWNELQSYYSKIELPYSSEQLEKDIHKLFFEYTGQDINSVPMAKAPNLNHGGMSGGLLSCKFWIGKGIPLLKERLKKKELYQND